jgi:hypothetical protein
MASKMFYKFDSFIVLLFPKFQMPITTCGNNKVCPKNVFNEDKKGLIQNAPWGESIIQKLDQDEFGAAQIVFFTHVIP